MKIFSPGRTIFICGVIFITSCQKGLEVGSSSSVVIQTNIVDSRVDADSRNFVAGDEIGLYVTQATKAMESVGNQIDNLAFSYNGTAWSGDLTRTSLVGTTFKAYSYYPFEAGAPNAHEIEYKVAADQSGGIVPDNYLLHGKSASTITVDRGSNTPTVIPLSFTNCLTRVIAEITVPTTYDGKTVKGIGEVALMQQPAACKLDVETGALSYDIYADRVDIKMHKTTNNYECLTIPNNIAAAEAYLRIKLIYDDDSKEFIHCYAPAAGIVFASNKIHTLQIDIIDGNELSCYTDFVFGAAGGTIEADIRTNMTETYTLTSQNSWITVADNKDVTAAALTTDQPRLGSLTLSNGVITIDIAVLQNNGIHTVTIAGTKWTTANLTGDASTNAGNIKVCDNPQDYGMFFKWASTFVYGRASNANEGGGFRNKEYTRGSSTVPTTQSKGYDYVGLNGLYPGDPCQKLGSSYKTPTSAQIKALFDAGSSGWKSYKGVAGWFFGPGATGANDSTIPAGCLFFPAAGFRYCNTGVLTNQGSGGYYWSSSVNSADNGWYLDFNSSGPINPEYGNARSGGFSVRCVEE